MKTNNFLKSNSDKCRRKIVIAEINILWNLDKRQGNNEKIVREIGKLHSIWFQGSSKDTRIAELDNNWQREQPSYTQSFM
jgi:cyanophycinase-like exopeptidase